LTYLFLLIAVINALSDTSYVWILLCQCHLQTHCYSDAEHCAREAITVIQKQAVGENVWSLLLNNLVKSLSLQNEEEKLREAVDKCIMVRQIFVCNIKSFIYLIDGCWNAICCSVHKTVDCFGLNT